MELLYTKLKFFGQKIYLQATKDKIVNDALKTLFYDSYTRTKPLEMRREDVQIVLAYTRKDEAETGLSVAEQKAGQNYLFEGE